MCLRISNLQFFAQPNVSLATYTEYNNNGMCTRYNKCIVTHVETPKLRVIVINNKLSQYIFLGTIYILHFHVLRSNFSWRVSR